MFSVYNEACTKPSANQEKSAGNNKDSSLYSPV